MKWMDQIGVASVVKFNNFNNIKFFVCLHGDKTYNSFVCGNTT
jgi:hypothetical protein